MHPNFIIFLSFKHFTKKVLLDSKVMSETYSLFHKNLQSYNLVSYIQFPFIYKNTIISLTLV